MSVQHDFKVVPSGDAELDRLQYRIQKALDRIAAQATPSQLTNQSKYVTVGTQQLQNEVRGATVNASSSILAVNGAYQQLSGTSTINFISSAGLFDGFRVEYYVTAGLTFVHHAIGGSQQTVLPLHLLTGANTPVAAGKVIVFRLDYAFNFWIQIG